MNALFYNLVAFWI